MSKHKRGVPLAGDPEASAPELMVRREPANPARARTRAACVTLAGVSAMIIAGCAQLPKGPSVLVLPGIGKTLEQLQIDDAACRQSATQEVQREKASEVPPQRRYDIAYVQCMYARGHQVPVVGQPERDTSSSSSAAPPGTPTAAPVVWPPTRAQVECEMSGGVWRSALDFCEFPSPDFPFRRWR